jgi:hypothetical protein
VDARGGAGALPLIEARCSGWFAEDGEVFVDGFARGGEGTGGFVFDGSDEIGAEVLDGLKGEGVFAIEV